MMTQGSVTPTCRHSLAATALESSLTPSPQPTQPPPPPPTAPSTHTYLNHHPHLMLSHQL